MTTVLLSLGSNLRPHHYLRLALDVLQERFGRIVGPVGNLSECRAEAHAHGEGPRFQDDLRCP